MSALPAVVSQRLPAMFAQPSARLRRALIVAAALLVVAGAVAAAMLWPADHVPSPAAAASAIDQARARAVARVKEHAVTVARPASTASADRRTERVADASRAGDLFGKHSWYVPPPPPPPAAPPPPPVPTAPPFPYTAMGSYAPDGAVPVYFLARADRVIDAHVGEKIDGVYEFESADKGQLVFNYLPLNIRQTIPLGAAP